MGTPHKPRDPKPQRFSFTIRCMSKDNQLAVCSPTVHYQSTAKMDTWFTGRLSQVLERQLDEYVGNTFLYDVTTDRNPAKDLIKKLTDMIKTALKQEPKPVPAVKFQDFTLIIKRDR